jgi:hypothetical protein
LDILSELASGQLARLIPSTSDTNKEKKATSVVLASFMAVPEFTARVHEQLGVPIRKRTKIQCYTEVVFKHLSSEGEKRPDGLIVVKTGKKLWCALVESKIGRNDLVQDQIESYLVLAKELKVDALITISNQFTPTPRHHPIKVSGKKTQLVNLFHFSWLELKSIAAILVNEKKIADHDQAYILSEVVRYLDSSHSGVEKFSKMPPSWKCLCSAIQNGAAIGKSSNMVIESIGAWHQLMRQLTLDLSITLGQSVQLHLSREKKKIPSVLLSEEIDSLQKTSCLNTDLNIPDNALRVKVTADITRKMIFVSMRLNAPKDKKRATASINWLLRQLKKKDGSELSVRAYWPRKKGTTVASLESVRQNPSIIIPEGSNQIPVAFEVFRVVDIGARFKGVRTFVEDVSGVVPAFYKDAGQELTNWVAKSSKVKSEILVEKKRLVEKGSPTIFSRFLTKN